MPEVIRPSSIDPDAPRRALVPRVYAERAGTAFKVLAFRLRKAILGQDHDALVKAASAMTSEERYAALEQFEAEDLVKSGSAMPADTSRAVPAGPVNWAAAARLPRYGGRPAQPAQAPAPAPPPPIYTLGEGKVRKTYHPQRGNVVHFTTGDGMLLHGKLIDWGTGGAIVAAPEGEFTVDWTEIHEGVHPSAQAEHAEHVEKSQARARDREWRETTRLLVMTPEERARHFEQREIDLP